MRRKVMICKIERIPLVLIEVLYETLFTSPHVNIVLDVSEMRSKTGAKIACTKHENLRVLHSLSLGFGVDHFRGRSLKSPFGQ